MVITKINHLLVKNSITSLFEKIGMNLNDSEYISDSLVDSNLSGYDSHGIMRVPHYIERFENKTTKIITNIKAKRISNTISLIDGNHGAGQIVSREAINTAVNLAKKCGIGCVGVKNSNHFGRAAYYTNYAASQGMIGIAMTHTDTNTLAYGGREPYFGSNALAFSCPSNNLYPVCLDFSMTSVSFGKVYDAEINDKKLPDGSAVNENGELTRFPHEVSNLLPAAGYKGYALSMMIEILCAILTGNPFGKNVVDMYKDIEKPRKIGHFFLVIKIDSFVDQATFLENINKMINELHSIQPDKNSNGVKIPGEIEFNQKKVRMKEGIPLPQKLIRELNSIFKKYEINQI